MFDISTVSKRYFDIKLTVAANGGKEHIIELEVEPPKLKVLKKITALSKSKDEDAIEDLLQAVKMILSKNKSGYLMPDEIIENLDFDELQQILTAYFEWLSQNKNSPN